MMNLYKDMQVLNHKKWNSLPNQHYFVELPIFSFIMRSSSNNYIYTRNVTHVGF